MKKVWLVLFILCVAAVSLTAAIPARHGAHRFTPTVQERDRSWIQSEWEYDFMNYSPDMWDPEDKIQFFYDSVHPARVDSLWSFWSDYLSTAWFYEASGVITYMPNGEYVSTITSYDGAAYSPQWRYNCTYDGQNRLTGYQYSTWSGSAWTQTEELQITYNAAGAFQFVYSYFDNGSSAWWYDRVVFGFDTPGRIISEIWQYSDDAFTWYDGEKYTYTYNAADTTTLADLVSRISHKLVLTMAMNNYTDYWDWISYGMVNEEIYYIWDTNNWYQQERYVFDYSGTRLAQRWFYEYLAGWQQTGLHSYSYDTAGNVLQDLEQLYVAGTPPYWEDNSRQLFTWTASSAADDPSSPELPELALRIEPNPFSAEVSIEALSRTAGEISLQIFNIKGEMVSSFISTANTTALWNGKDLKGRDLPTGIYLIRAKQGANESLAKCIKIK